MNILCVLSFKQLTEVHFIVDKLYHISIRGLKPVTGIGKVGPLRICDIDWYLLFVLLQLCYTTTIPLLLACFGDVNLIVDTKIIFNITH